jgi:hypothetical protein
MEGVMSSCGHYSFYMLSNYASKILELLNNLRTWQDSLYEIWKPGEKDQGTFADQEKFIAWKKCIEDALSLCDELDLKSSPTRIALFLEEFSPDINPFRCSNCVREIYSLIEADLRGVYFESIAPSKADFYDHSLGREAVAQAFPSAVPDLKEAGTCFALNRNTACVFHIIRAMEIALRALAKCSGVKVKGKKTVPLEYQEWNCIIEQITAKSKDYVDPKRGPKKLNALSFFSACIMDFNFFKDSIRNILVHNRRGLYNSPDAFSALIRAKECLERLAPIVNEHRTRKLTKSDFK